MIDVIPKFVVCLEFQGKVLHVKRNYEYQFVNFTIFIIHDNHNKLNEKKSKKSCH